MSQAEKLFIKFPNIESSLEMFLEFERKKSSLPQIDVDKINFGQYGFKGNNSITLSVKSVLKSKSMQTLLDENGEFIPLIIDK